MKLADSLLQLVSVEKVGAGSVVCRRRGGGGGGGGRSGGGGGLGLGLSPSVEALLRRVFGLLAESTTGSGHALQNNRFDVCKLVAQFFELVDRFFNSLNKILN